jgi:hypothetical protein
MTIDDILGQCENIEKVLNRFMRGRFFVKKLYKKDTWEEYIALSHEIITRLMRILRDSGNNFNKAIALQIKEIKRGKIQLSKHIKNHSPLEQVGEIQLTRLDRQIEQFEELQKVLVKM